MKEKGGRGKMVTAVKPIRPTIMEFKNDIDMTKFINDEVGRKKHDSPEAIKVREMMRKHREQRKK